MGKIQEKSLFDQWKEKADQGDVRAQYHLAISYINGIGVDVNPTEALKWYRLAQEY